MRMAFSVAPGRHLLRGAASSGRPALVAGVSACRAAAFRRFCSGKATATTATATATATTTITITSGKAGGRDAPSEADRFLHGLPRACRDPRSGRFMNPWLTAAGEDPCKRTASDVFRLMREWLGGAPSQPEISTPESVESLLEITKPQAVDWEAVRSARGNPDGPVLAVWLGHASVLCVCRGQLLLCDPVFSQRCSPFSFAGPQRLVPCPVDPLLSDWPQDLAPNVVAVSHTHYDHLDEATVLALKQRFPEVKWAAPLGLGPWFLKHGIMLDAELDWWQEDDNLLGPSLALVCLPAQHWANRWPWDRNVTLWCGFGIVAKGQSAERRQMPFLFAGDTGYCPVFKQIGSMFEVGLAAVPIGAYEPRWFMSPQHCDPEEAVLIVKDLGADAALAIHWGTFPLTLESSVRQLQGVRLETAGSQSWSCEDLHQGPAWKVAVNWTFTACFAR
ncbi:unnamed protein product [Polarella glacialis]|uniref:Metallo-beta-lactamase domain-containing protein n=1 Tax=Polarella glacialis TaxID=89957 RepID=A0A813G8I9_POLGL|nr:unnamed protein product [Polarella glacialis]